MASRKKQPTVGTPTPTVKNAVDEAGKAAVKARRKRNKELGVTKTGANIGYAIQRSKELSEKEEKAGEERELEAKEREAKRSRIASDTTEEGAVRRETEARQDRQDLSEEEKLLRNPDDSESAVDAPDEEEQSITSDIKNETGYGEVGRTLAKTQREAEVELEQEDERRSERLGVPSSIFPSQSGPQEDPAERRRRVDRETALSRARRREEALRRLGPSPMPPVSRTVNIETGAVSEPVWTVEEDENKVKHYIRAFDDSGNPISTDVSTGPGTTRETAEVRDRGPSVPLNETPLELGNQFLGIRRASNDLTPDVLPVVEEEDLVTPFRLRKGIAGTTRFTRTRKQEDTRVAREREAVLNDAALAESLAEVATVVPDFVKTGDYEFRGGDSSVTPTARETTRPGVAADIDINSQEGASALEKLREISGNTVSGFGEMSRASQKRPAFGSTTNAPGVKRSDATSQSQDALQFFLRNLDGGQFQELKSFAADARRRAAGMPTEWSPEMGLHTTEGFSLTEANIDEASAKALAERVASGKDAGTRAIPIATPPTIDYDSTVGKKAQELADQINAEKEALGGVEGLQKLVDLAVRPYSRISTREIVTAAPQPYSDGLSDEQKYRIRLASSRTRPGPVDPKTGERTRVPANPDSPGNTRRRLRVLRRNRGERAEGPTTTDAAIRLSSGIEGQKDEYETLMQKFPGQGGGEPTTGGLVDEQTGSRLANIVTKPRGTLKIDVPLVTTDKATGDKTKVIDKDTGTQTVQKFDTGSPQYTDTELEAMRQYNPDQADVHDPVSRLRLPRVGGQPIPPAPNQVPLVSRAGEPVNARVRVIKRGLQRNTVRAVATPPDNLDEDAKPIQGRGYEETRESPPQGTPREPATNTVEQEWVKEDIEPQSAPLNTLYFPDRSGGFRESRVVQPGAESGVYLDLYNQPRVVDPEALARTPAARRAANEGLRTRQIAAARSVLNHQQNFPAAPGLTLDQAQKLAKDLEYRKTNDNFARKEEARASAEATQGARRDFESQPLEAQKAARAGFYIQEPSYEINRSRLQAAWIGQHAARTGEMWADNPRLPAEGGNRSGVFFDIYGKKQVRTPEMTSLPEGVLTGQSREKVMNDVFDRIRSGATGYGKAMPMYGGASGWGRQGSPAVSQGSLGSQDPRDKKTTTKQIIEREYGGPGGGRTSGGRGVMDGDQWGAMRGAPVNKPGDKIRKPGDRGYVGLGN